MSMRPMIYPVSSVDPIRVALGRHDESLVDRMVGDFARRNKVKLGSPQAQDFRDRARCFIRGRLRDDEELGWAHFIELAAGSLGLLETENPINDDWKWMAWCDYGDEVQARLPEDARQLFRWLVEGRNLEGAGDKAAGDGCYYAWLDPSEVERLHEAIGALEVDEESLGELSEFHEELLEWLEACRGRTLLIIGG